MPSCFFDFGCVHRFDPAFLELGRKLFLSVMRDDMEAAHQALLGTGFIVDPQHYDRKHSEAWLRAMHAPFLSEHTVFDPASMRRGFALMSTENVNLRAIKLWPQMAFLNHFYFGVHAVLVRLGARGPYRTRLLRILEGKR